MIEPSNPVDETQRLRALRDLRILDTPPEERFDRITRLASQLFDVPISVISLIDKDRQWFKSHHGLDTSETSRSASFCGHAILQPDIFHVADAHQDKRFFDNPLVAGDPKIRFYAGIPLHAPGGEALGTLCLIDTKPRQFSDADKELLRELARWAQDSLHQFGRATPATAKLRLWLGLFVTALLVGIFEFLSPHFPHLLNPPAALVISIVFAAYFSGLASGIASALVAVTYTAHFFSIPGQPFQFAGGDLTRVLSWAVAMPSIAIMTGLLRRGSKRQFEATMGDAITAAYLSNVAASHSELQKSHTQIQRVMENAPMHFAFFDESMRCRYANPSYARTLGMEVSDLIGRKTSEFLVDQGVTESDFATLYLRILAGTAIEQDLKFRHASGRISDFKVNLVPQFANSGQVTGYYSFVSDITELKKATAENARITERLSLAIEGSKLCLWDWNMQKDQIFLDSAWSRMLGQEAGEMTMNAAELFATVHPDDQELLYTLWMKVLKGQEEYYAAEHRVRTHNGEWLWIASLGKVVERAAEGVALRMTGTNADISERKSNEARIEILATTDPLTSLPNRRVLFDRISHAMLNADRNGKTLFALLFIDLDHFKDINDLIGHNLGDQLLQQAAARISGVVRKGDTLARLGGDEFAVVLERLQEPGQAGDVTQKIISAFAAPFFIEGYSLSISCSIGISLFPNDASDANLLLRNADLSMYAAKSSGRSTYRYYTPEINARAVERQTLEQALRTALEVNGQFELYYQPKFSFHTGQLAGVEALLRWNHPQLGQISPARFIPIAEETRMILPIGEWALRQACHQMMEWTRLGHRSLSLAVNLSVAQINGELLRTVEGALRDSKLDAGRLEIEITENVLLRDADENIVILGQLSGCGLRIAIDDFGTGYSSLSYLRRFKLDIIKIDQSFVRNMTVNENDLTIVKAIIALARSLKMTVVAEGVESIEQKNALQEMGCDEWQGFLNFKPLPADEFEKRFLLDTAAA